MKNQHVKKEEIITCNACGKKIIGENGVIKEDFICIEKVWGYFSKKDGEYHLIYMCESCYDEFIANLHTPIVKEAAAEII